MVNGRVAEEEAVEKKPNDDEEDAVDARRFKNDEKRSYGPDVLCFGVIMDKYSTNIDDDTIPY